MTPLVSSHQAVGAEPAYITSERIDIPYLLHKYEDEEAGAVVLFNGTVRRQSLGKEVSHLFYEAAETMAHKMIGDLINEIQIKWQLTSVFAVHRIGKVLVGESAIAVITASPHRKEAYEANRYLVEKIKHELPLWKCEYFADATKKWGGNCSCQEITGNPNQHIYDI
jgi:molybdopterin synthase catalytic subunit